jgi:hypothetical protein
VSLSRTGNTSGQKGRDESTEAELSLGVDGTLDVASGGDQSVETSAEAERCSTVGMASDTGIRRYLSVTLESCTDRRNTLDDSHAVDVGDVKANLSFDLSLEGNANTGATLKSATDTSADAGELCVKASNHTSCELAISLESNTSTHTSASTDACTCTSTAVGSESSSEASHNTTSQTEASANRTAYQTLCANTSTSADTCISTDTSVCTSTAVSTESTETVEKAESATLQLSCLRGVVGRGSRSGGDESSKSESVVNHVD